MPEKREEITTEGGLNISKEFDTLDGIIKLLKKRGNRGFSIHRPNLEILKGLAKRKELWGWLRRLELGRVPPTKGKIIGGIFFGLNWVNWRKLLRPKIPIIPFKEPLGSFP